MISGLKSLFKRGGLTRRKHALAPGMRVYAVGDVHGQHDLLIKLLKQISDDAARAPVGSLTQIVMLGDYVDRGLGSRDVIETLSRMSDSPTRLRFLKGNHEAAMLDFLGDPAAGPTWVQFGGGETLASYGVKPPAPNAESAAWEEARLALADALPEHHRRFLENLELYVLIEPYIFAHAGVDPTKSLEDQTEADFLWIRDAFLYSPREFDHVVVHGHTPEPDYHYDHRRIGIDTGAYLTGVLTAVRIEGEAVSFLQARRSDL